MVEDNSQSKNSQTQDTAPDNLPGVEVTDPNETTQQISKQVPIENLQKVATKIGLEGIVEDNLEDVIKSAEAPKGVIDEKEIEEIEEMEDVVKYPKLKVLRTYKGDLAKVMWTKEGSLVGIVSAESDKRYKIGQTKPIKIEDEESLGRSFIKKVLIIILSTILVILGVGSVFYFYGKSNIDITAPNPKAASIIFTDEDFEFNITDLSKRQILNELTSIKDQTELSVGRIKNIFITKSFINEEGFERSLLISASNFLDSIEANVTASFSRSLRSEFMVGAHVFDGNKPFIILKTSFYENAFVGMLGWEANIKDNLSPLFDLDKKISALPVENTTSVSRFKSQIFNDVIIKNKDARVLKNEKGEVSIIYSFIDKETILITTNENTFSEIITRLTASRTLR